MNDIKALIEAEKKATKGPWVASTCCVYAAHQLDDRGMTDEMPIIEVHENEDEQFIAAARNAMPEIIEQDRKYRELVEWFRREGAHGEFCGYYDNNPCTCGFDHISELVGEE